MTVALKYKDTITIVDQNYDGYGDETINEQVDVKSLFLQSTGQSHGNNVDQIDTSAHAYVDPTNAFIIENANRLEGMSVIANPFNADASQSWYKIIRVVVGMDKLLCNKIDTVHVYLKKSVVIP